MPDGATTASSLKAQRSSIPPPRDAEDDRIVASGAGQSQRAGDAAARPFAPGRPWDRGSGEVRARRARS